MKLRIASLAGVVLIAASSAWAQSVSVAFGEPMVHSGLFIMRPDGKHSGSAVQTGEKVGADLGGTLYMTPCSGIGAANAGRQISAFATDIWQMSGRVLEMNDQQASVQIGWKRLRRGGQDENSAEQTTTLTLKRGERITIESINVPAAGSCDARSAQLDVVFASRQELYGISPEQFAAGSGGGTGRASGGLRPEYVQGTVKESGAGGGGAVSFGMQKGYPGLERLNADLWLVRSTPGRADETLHVAKQVMPIPSPYTFAPLTIQTATGSLSVQVEGTVEVGMSSDGERKFHFTARRTTTALTSNRPVRDGQQPVVEGSTKTTVGMPGPEEVLSFEMPPLRTAEGVTLPDRLSIRVRLSSSSK